MAITSGVFYSQVQGLKLSTNNLNRIIVSTGGTTTFTGNTNNQTLIDTRGINGQIMTVNDSITDPIFAINNSAGNTLLQVNRDNSIRFNRIQQSANTRFLVADTNNVLSYRTDVATGNTLYTGDGSLSGNRVVTMSNNSLIFSSTSDPNNLSLVNGNVGIGNSSPSAKLDIGSSTSFFRVTPNWGGFGGTWLDFNVGGPSGIGHGGPGGTAWIGYAAVAGQWFLNSNPGDIAYRGSKLLYGNSGGNAAMSVSNDRVGINTVNPTNLLHVVGTGTSPVKIENLTSSVSSDFIVVDASGNLYKKTFIPSTGASCPDVIKIAAVSGLFNSNSSIIPFLNDPYIGNSNYGWSYGNYDLTTTSNGSGLMTVLNAINTNCLIPLPADFVVGDIIKICGNILTRNPIAAGENLNTFLNNVPLNNITYNFYLTVSYVTCEQLNTIDSSESISLSTLIPVQTFPFILSNSDSGGIARVCFSTSVTLNTVKPGCTTFLLVGLQVGSDVLGYGSFEGNYKFTYTLDGIKYCVENPGNILIRNCCEPTYTEIIANNGVAVGSAFSDSDGNCWSVVSTTVSNITSTRTKQTTYTGCTACLAENTCPQNYLVASCCFDSDQIFAAVIESPALNLYDGFVDTFGFCWEVVGFTPLPSTYVIEVATVYPGNGNPGSGCIPCEVANTCPQLVNLTSCCSKIGGYSTLELIGGGVIDGDIFVDQFGLCWRVKSLTIEELFPGIYPNLNFINAVQRFLDCVTCIESNPCPQTVFYTLKNCCDEQEYVAELNFNYQVDQLLTIISQEMAGCFFVTSFSNTGTTTLTNAEVISVSGPFYGTNKSIVCADCIIDNCYSQCCFRILTDGNPITAYLCDGTYVYQQEYGFGTELCVKWYDNRKELPILGACCFQVYNPSATENISIEYTTCEGPGDWIKITLIPGSNSPCVTCVRMTNGFLAPVRYEVVSPNTCPPPGGGG